MKRQSATLNLLSVNSLTSSYTSGDEIPQDRKKTLNRVAATRYREKKRQERGRAKDELGLLETENKELNAELFSVETEIKYLKGLIAEIQARTCNH